MHVQRLSRALAGAGHEVTVVHSLEGYAALAGAAEPPRSRDGGVRLVGIDAGRGRVSPAITHVTGRPLLVRRRLREVLSQGWDVIHFHNPSLLGGPEVLQMGAGVRLYTLHEQWLVCPTHVLFRYQREVCPKRRCLTCQLSYRRPPQLWRRGGLLERGVASLDALIAPSRTSARLHSDFAHSVRIERIPHFVERPPEGPAHDQARPYFLYVGRLEPVKGVDRAIEAFRRRAGEDLLIVGDGTLAKRLRRQAAGLPNVRFLGERAPAELGPLYRGARALISPSAGHEAFGLTAVEAFAHGTPAIVPAFGALQELIEDSGAGFTFRDEQELDLALGRLARDDALRDELGRTGLRAFAERWSVERHLEQYLGLIAELGGRRAPGAAGTVPA